MSNQLARGKSSYLPRDGNREYYFTLFGERLYNISLFCSLIHATLSRSVITTQPWVHCLSRHLCTC